jgi:hypothetical protein
MSRVPPMARQTCSQYSTSVHVFESGMGYRRHACTYPRFRLLKIVHFDLADEIIHITPSVKSSMRLTGDLRGPWRSSAYPSASHCVIKVIRHLVYQVKNNDLQQLKTRKEKAVATVTHNILPNMR